MPTMNIFQNKVAIVTGASSGIGRATSLELAKKGTVVCLVGRNRKMLEKTARDIKNTPTHIYQIDLLNDKNLEKFVIRFKRDFNRLDFLIHSAGVITLGPFKTASIKDFDLQYKVNVRAPYLLTQLLLPFIKKCKGQIVFLNSTACLSPSINNGQYAATKAALKAVADSLRMEVNKDGIRVLSIFPGRTATPMQSYISKVEGKKYHPTHLIQPDDIATLIVHILNVPQTAQTTDIVIKPLKKSL